MIFDPSGRVAFVTNANGVFTVTSTASSNTGTILGGIWLDFNNDGRVDAYVIKNGAPNQLFRNQGNGKF